MNAAPARQSLHRNLAGRRLGRYEVLTQLASGGMAAVYVARAQGVAGFERLVAIKVLHPHLAHEEEFISMFLDEARLAARIRHPNVVPTLDISDSDGDGYFLVMDYVEGDHLGALLQRAAKKGDRLPPPVVGRIVVDALTGLSAAHQLTDENGQRLEIVHRDVSPHNIMVGADGVARLTDFGVAKAEVRLSSTREGQFKGKLAYMAPEQASSGEADQRSDLFSMGIILWESLAGRRLFRGANNAETISRILESDVPTLSSESASLAPFDEVASRALTRDRDGRFQSADDFIDALEKATAAVGGMAGTRQIAEAVRRYGQDKLEEDRQRIRQAIDSLGRAEIGEPSLPLPPDGSAVSVKARQSEPDVHADTIAARPGALHVPPRRAAPTKKGFLLAVVLLLLAAAVGLALGLGLSGDRRADPEPELAREPTAEPEPPPKADPEPELAREPTAEPGPKPALPDVVPHRTTSHSESKALHRAPRARPRDRTGPRPEPETEGDNTPPPSATTADDDLIVNPYRR